MKKKLIILMYAFSGWFLCGATMGIGLAITTEFNAQIIHAIGAPIFFGILSWLYTKRYSDPSPLLTASIFVGFIIVVDFFLVALVILRSLDMFRSFLGTWLPFMLIFSSSFIMGIAAEKRKGISK